MENTCHIHVAVHVISCFMARGEVDDIMAGEGGQRRISVVCFAIFLNFIRHVYFFDTLGLRQLTFYSNSIKNSIERKQILPRVGTGDISRLILFQCLVS